MSKNTAMIKNIGMIELAVVGHPNKGKSSIVATLSRNHDIHIDSFSGTTTQSTHYPVSVDGEVLYHLIDTPGFQRTRFVMEWLIERAPHAHLRKQAVADFIREPGHAEQFQDEVQLLTPIVGGAGIIYVIDGGIPYSKEYELEMEILRWTGQPRMAIINPIGSQQYVEQWRQVLDQFFSIVRVFNPLTASYSEQCSILNAFAELSAERAETIRAATDKLKLARVTQHRQAAKEIVGDLDLMLSYSVSIPWSDDKAPALVKKGLREKFEQELVDKEHLLREKILNVYQHESVTWQEQALALNTFPLFDQSRWNLWGMDRKRAILLSAGAGAATGVVVDIGLGGHSLMAGSLLGGVAGGLSSLWLSYKTMDAKTHNSANGKCWQLGPVKDPQFGFVLLARALFYTQAVAGRTHADQQPLTVDAHHNFDWLNNLGHKQQVELAGMLRKANSRSLNSEESKKLADLISSLTMTLLEENKS